ncbi:chitotriosidase-1-like [Lingula anatina]|uniref:Chitotriosidase-1-like n=1 Tax=Lingula anatina TaxID=7574 RepID=A0A1S3JWG1_LINAN|nr:chitotriosidase-1-like [Lingula anatina]|eukprot:XP_013414708.1 chitotriosidase-1-like [Lingula anatina]
MTEVLIYLVTLACLLWAPTKADKKIFCYYSSFAQSRQGMARFLPEDINPQLCTHVLFAFVDVSPDGRNLKPSNRNHISRGGKPGLYERTVALKQRNPELKVLLAVGGWAQGSKQFVPMMSSVENRQAWVRNVVRYLRKYGFDGLDMDWEFPGARGSPPEDKQRFTKLMKELQEAFRSEAQISGKDKLLLTLATAGGMYFISKSYEPELLIPHVDYFLLMAYNYHGMWEKFTGHHSGLYPRADEKDRDRELNQQWTIDFWLGKGARKEQIIVGIATYSMTFTLRDPTQHGLMAPATGAGEGGKYTREPGVMAYYEICQNLRSGRWNRAWIADQMSPYYYGDRQWGGYDDVESVTYKACRKYHV